MTSVSSSNNTIALSALRNPTVLLATGFGSGLAPFAPGTFGTAASLILFAFLSTQTWLYLAVCVLAFGAGVWICDVAANKLGVHDHPGIVWDEFVGMWITMAFVPISWQTLLAGFLLFRLFDVLKPWPIRWLDQQVSGGFGIMIDDVLAGVFAWIGLQLLLRYTPYLL